MINYFQLSASGIWLYGNVFWSKEPSNILLMHDDDGNDVFDMSINRIDLHEIIHLKCYTESV